MIALDQIHQDNIDPNSTDVVQYPGPAFSLFFFFFSTLTHLNFFFVALLSTLPLSTLPPSTLPALHSSLSIRSPR